MTTRRPASPALHALSNRLDHRTRRRADEPEQAKGTFGTGVALTADASGSLIRFPRAELGLGAVWGSLGRSQPPRRPPLRETPARLRAAPPAPRLELPAAGSGVLASNASALPAPRLAATGNVVRLAGVARVRLPGSNRFTPLAAGEQIPFGSVVDATGGRVSATTAPPRGDLRPRSSTKASSS